MSSLVNFQNTLYLLYTDKPSATATTSKLYYNTSSDGGDTWFNKTAISNNASNIKWLNSKSAFYNNIHIAYSENVTESGEEKYYLNYINGYLNNGTLTFNEQRLFTGSPDDQVEKKYIDMDITRDKCHLVWVENTNDIYYASIDNTTEDGTITVSAKTVPVEETSAIKHTQIISDSNNNLYLFYVRKRTSGTGSVVKYVKFNNDFQSWSQPKTVIFGAADQEDSTISVAISPKDDSISILYVATDLKVKCIFSINNAQNWSAPVTVFADTDYDYACRLYSDCLGNLSAFVGAKSNIGSPAEKDIIYYSYSTNRGVSWTTQEEVERFDNDAYISSAEDIKPTGTYDEKLALCMTYEEINEVELLEQNNVIFFKTVNGVYDPYVASAIPRVSIDPVIITKDSITRSLTNPNIIQDSNKQLFIYEYDSIFRTVTERKSVDYGNTWESQTAVFTVTDDLNFLKVISDGSTKWAFYQLESSGLNEIYARRKTTFTDSWESETKIFPLGISPLPIPGTSELPLDVILIDEYIFISIYYQASSQDFIYTAVLDDDFTLVDSDTVQINIGAETEANGITGISLDYYVDNNSPNTIGILVAYNETYLTGGSPDLTRKRIKLLNYKAIDRDSPTFGSSVTTTLDDNWADNDVPNSSYLMSPKVITDKSIVNPIAHVLYCKTTYDEELSSPEQIVYWAMMDVDTSTLIEYPTEVLAPEQNGTEEQVYFTEVTGVVSQSTDSNISRLHIYGFGDHISIFGTNYTGWASTAQYNISEQERYRTNKSLQSGQTYAPVLTSKVITMLKDDQNSIHYVTTQYDDSAYGTTYYSKVIDEDIPSNESLSLIPRPIGFEL